MQVQQIILVLLIFLAPAVNAHQALNILFVVEMFPKGTETFILNQITRLIDRGHSIWIHAYQKGKKSELCSLIQEYNLLERTSFGAKFPYNLNAFDILYCQFGIVGNKMLKQKKMTRSEAKIVTCFRGYDMSQYLLKYPTAYTNLLQEGDLFLPVCDYFAQKLISLGADSEKVKVHHSAIDCAMFSYKHRIDAPKTVTHMVSISRLVVKKGIEDVLYALAKVVKKNRGIRYTIVGEGFLRGHLEGLVHTLGLGAYVTFAGSLAHKEVVSILYNTDIFILPSKKAKTGDQEGIPNVLKEAMACGVPVISTYHSGIPELVDHGVSGILVQEGDVQGLVDAILYLMGHPDKREDFGTMGRRKIEAEFNIDTHILRLEQLFYDLLEL